MMSSESTAMHALGVSRYWLLKSLLAYLANAHQTSLGSEVMQRHLRMIGMRLGAVMDARYRALLCLSAPMSLQEFSAVLLEIREDLQLNFQLEIVNAQELRLIVDRCPWDCEIGDIPGFCYLISCIFGTLAALSFDTAQVRCEHDGAPAHAGCRFRLHAPSSTVEASPATTSFSRQEIEAIATVWTAQEPAQSEARDELEQLRTRGDYEALYHRQLELTERLGRALDMERAAAEQLRSFNRLKQDFLSNVSHELRTPITAVQGYLSLLEQEALGALSAEQLEAVQIALRNIDRLNRLVCDLLDFSSLSRGQCLLEDRPIAIATILAQALQRVDETARLKGIVLRLRVAGDPGQVLGDEEKLTQIVAHLLENAIKFSTVGHEVTLHATAQPAHALIEVQDHGIGMTPEQQEHVFTPFVQGDSGLTRRYGGLGMGLSLIQHIVALHGGEITISSTPGHGTTVRVLLPFRNAG